LEAIMPMLEFRLASATGKRPVFVSGGFGQRTIRTLDDLTRHIATKHGVHPHTVWKWYCKFQESSFPALANGSRADRGRSRYFAANAAAQHIVEKCLTPRISVREIHRVLRRELNDAAPCYGTVRSYIAALQAATARAGRKAVRP
jgi:hypothetical protein